MLHSLAEAALGAQNQSVPILVHCRGLCSPVPSQLASNTSTSSGLHSLQQCMLHVPWGQPGALLHCPQIHSARRENRQRPPPAGGLS